MVALAYISAFMKSVIYGSSVFFTGALVESVNIFDILALRFLMSFAVLWVLKTTRILKINVGIKDFFNKKSSHSVKDLFLAMLFEPVLYMLFETFGISMSADITTGVILSLAPISSCILESIILKEKTSSVQKIFQALGIIGVIYIAFNTGTSGGEDSVPGILFLLLAVVSGSLFSIFSRKSSENYSTLDRTYIYCLFGMIAFNVINIIRHLCNGTVNTYFKPYLSVENMTGFVFLAVVSAIGATLFNNFALSRMQASTMAAFGGVSTFVTVIIGVVFHNEKVYLYHVIGFILIFIRMVGVSFIEIRKDKSIKTQSE